MAKYRIVQVKTVIKMSRREEKYIIEKRNRFFWWTWWSHFVKKVYDYNLGQYVKYASFDSYESAVLFLDYYFERVITSVVDEVEI